MAGQGVCCSVCDSGNKAALACPACINNTLLYEKRRLLLELSERRAALFQQLHELLNQRQIHVDLEVRRQQLAAEAVAARERVRAAERALAGAQREAARLRASNAARRAAHERACAELSARRSEHMAHHPTLLRYQALTHSHVSAMLLSEQRSKLAVLLEALPLRVAAIRSPAAMMQQQQQQGGLGGGGGGGGSGSGGGAGASPIQVTICNLKLPDAASVSALMAQHPEATSSALGYLLLLAELLSTYLGGPLLHEGSFQGSTSVLWQQHSFWNRRPSCSNARLPLFLEEGGGGGGGGPGLSNPFPGLAAKVRGPSGWGTSSQGPTGPHNPSYTSAASPAPAPPASASVSGSMGAAASSAFAALSRVMTGGGVGGSGSTSATTSGAVGGGGGALSYTPPVDEALLRQRHTDLRLAYDMLLRSLACFTRDKMLPLGLQLPAGWGPLGWLAVLAAVLRRDGSSEAVLAAAQQAALAGPGGSGNLRVGPGGGAADGEGGGGGLEHDDDDDEAAEVEEDGWDVVQAPFLPPPPSQPDEVEHWTRAMFTDAHTAAGGGGSGGAGGAAVGRARQQAMSLVLGGLGAGGQGGPPGGISLERVRSIFST